VSFTEQEKELWDLTVDLWNKFLKLDPVHPDERTEFRHKLHDIQSIIMSRPTMRQMKGDIGG